MRNFMCVFLLVLLDKGASETRRLRCYETADEGVCVRKYYQKQEPGYKKNTFSCFKELEEKSNKCSPSKKTCIRAIITYVDNDTLIFTSCDSEQDDFPNCKKLLGNNLSEQAEKEVKSKDCEKCKEDHCNPRTMKAESTTIIVSPTHTEAPSKNANTSTERLPNIAVLIFVVLITFMF